MMTWRRTGKNKFNNFFKRVAIATVNCELTHQSTIIGITKTASYVPELCPGLDCSGFNDHHLSMKCHAVISGKYEHDDRRAFRVATPWTAAGTYSQHQNACVKIL